MTGLSVILNGTVTVEHPSQWELFVCDLPVGFGEDGRFSVIRAFPKAGTYVVSAALRRPFRWRGVGGAESSEPRVADCRVTVSTTPNETEHVRTLCEGLLGADGEIDADALQELVRANDMRAVPALWKAIDAHPDRESPARREAVELVGHLADLDSVPRLIRLLSDQGVYSVAYDQMMALGLWGPDVTQWRPHPTSSEEVRTVMERLSLIFAKRELALRWALHQ